MLSRPRLSWIRWCVAVLLTVASVGIARAGDAVGPPIAVWTDAATSFAPKVAFNPAHQEFLVVWHNAQGALSWDVYARRVALDGTLLSWFAVVAVPGELHWEPCVAYNEVRDEYLVAWGHRHSTWEEDVLAARVRWDGSWVGPPFVVNDEVNAQFWCDVVANPAHDEYLVSYTNHWADGTMDVAAQRVAGDGSLLSWANIATGTDPRHFTSGALLPELDQYLLVYNHMNTIGTWTVRGKLAPSNLAGVSVAPEIEVYTAAHAGMPVTAASPSGYLVVWYKGTPGEPWARRIAPDGTPLGPATGFRVSDTSGGYWTWPSVMQSVAYAPAVGYVVAWIEAPTAVTGDIRARVVAEAADAVVSRQWTIEGGPDPTTEPSVACAPWGNCLVAYQHGGNIEARLLTLHLFGDGFETGGTGGWSSAVP